ncbi:hypothetical protein IV203_021367 [Nitzschia inconspicua]|uniref:Uncharacterized protein n=1 Tax=Nitzschia inconspicua TaxID=303405 RepID=A0A9K3PD80_9STRA|nr:hypothetical protein IV203_021367 [Nitzschia inconspicua]
MTLSSRNTSSISLGSMTPIAINPLQPTKSTKKVSFNNDVWVLPLRRNSDEDVRQIWYGASELFAFRREGRDIALSFRKGLVPASPGQYRGFENTAPNRQQQRHLSIRCTLSAHRKGLNTEDTASVAKMCNEWSTELAFVQACHDYFDIYQPHLTCMIPDISSIPGPHYPSAWVQESAAKNMRRVNLRGDQSCRRVRQRIS